MLSAWAQAAQTAESVDRNKRERKEEIEVRTNNEWKGVMSAKGRGQKPLGVGGFYDKD